MRAKLRYLTHSLALVAIGAATLAVVAPSGSAKQSPPRAHKADTTTCGANRTSIEVQDQSGQTAGFIAAWSHECVQSSNGQERAWWYIYPLGADPPSGITTGHAFTLAGCYWQKLDKQYSTGWTNVSGGPTQCSLSVGSSGTRFYGYWTTRALPGYFRAFPMHYTCAGDCSQITTDHVTNNIQVYANLN